MSKRPTVNIASLSLRVLSGTLQVRTPTGNNFDMLLQFDDEMEIWTVKLRFDAAGYDTPEEAMVALGMELDYLKEKLPNSTEIQP